MSAYSSQNRKLPVLSAMLAALFTLPACGPVKRINPPAASLQRLAVEADGRLAVTLRVQNHSDVSTRVARFDGTIELGGRAPTPFAVAIDLDVPAHAAEVVVATLPGSDWRPAPDRTLRYRLAGRLATSEPRGNYEVEYESMLSPVPGIPGEYR
ncbi:MAG TPA: LEA type 2 family protein [Candidatus Saccharimonadia bacterium]|nr:LEA type 2 family protein [Candidatus Saccharimonadia bacterium]